MSENICISVSDHRGTSHYLINRFKKRYLALSVSLLLAIITAGSYSVYNLYQQNLFSNQKLNLLNIQTEQLTTSLSEENAANQALTQELAVKKRQHSIC